jgi:hypothetical protein
VANEAFAMTGHSENGVPGDCGMPGSVMAATTSSATGRSTAASMASSAPSPALSSAAYVTAASTTVRTAAKAASTAVMAEHHAVAPSSYIGVADEVVRGIVEANRGHIFLGGWVLFRHDAPRNHRLHQLGFNQRLSHASGTLDRMVDAPLHTVRRITDDVHTLGRWSLYSGVQATFLYSEDQYRRFGIAQRMPGAVARMPGHDANLMVTSLHEMAGVMMPPSHNPPSIDVAVRTVDPFLQCRVEVTTRVIGDPL